MNSISHMKKGFWNLGKLKCLDYIICVFFLYNLLNNKKIMIYRPLLIETCQYKYKFGNEEKSFTIKKKLDYYPKHRTVSRTHH